MSILTLTPKEGTVLIVAPVHIKSIEFKIFDGYLIEFATHWRERTKLPPGKYSIVGKLCEITEEQSRELVKRISPESAVPFYKDYMFYDQYRSALESLHSLIRASGGKETDNILILKQE